MTSHTEPILSLHHVSIGYQSAQPLVRNISLSLPQGCFAALLGPNGSGKSTLLKTILGLLPPLSGQVRLGHIRGRRAVLGYVPQRDALDPLYPISCLELVLMGCCSWKPPGRFWNHNDREWARACLDQVGGTDWSGRNFAHLSGGQAQRVLLARALASKPDLLIMDEPTAGVDADALQSISNLWLNLHATTGLSILTVSHDLAWVHHSADLILSLEQDRIVQSPNPTRTPTASS